MEKIHPTIGPKIKYYRKLRGWSLRTLAEHTDMGWGLIGRYERRKTAPQYPNVLKLAKALGVSIEQLWDHSPPPNIPIPSKSPPKR